MHLCWDKVPLRCKAFPRLNDCSNQEEVDITFLLTQNSQSLWYFNCIRQPLVKCFTKVNGQLYPQIKIENVLSTVWKSDLPTLKNKNSYFDIQKFVFCTKKSYFLKLISQNAFWTFILYYMYFSYGKWMQEGLPNLTGSCHLAREWKIIKVLHNKKNSINLTFSGNRYIQTDT